MGASGILGGLIDGSDRSFERICFIIGVVAAPALLSPLMSSAPQTHLTGNMTIIVVAGLLVGVGTRIANGCTSGHGVCGISRFSLRGIVATLIYIGAGALTLSVARHMFGVI